MAINDDTEPSADRADDDPRCAEPRVAAHHSSRNDNGRFRRRQDGEPLPAKMPRVIKVKKAQLREALRKTGGLRTAAAQLLGVSHSSINRWIETRWPDLRQVEEECRDRVVDLCISKLLVAIQKGEPWAVRTGLRALGHRRGYTFRQEVTGPDGKPVQHAVVQLNISVEVLKRLTDQELARLRDGDLRPVEPFVRALGAGHVEKVN